MLIPLGGPGPLQSKICLIICHFFRKQICKNITLQRSCQKMKRHSAGHLRCLRKRASGLTAVEDICVAEREREKCYITTPSLLRLYSVGGRWMSMEHWFEWHAQGKAKYWRITCASATFSSTNPTLNGLWVNPGFRGKRLATNWHCLLQSLNCLRKGSENYLSFSTNLKGLALSTLTL